MLSVVVFGRLVLCVVSFSWWKLLEESRLESGCVVLMFRCSISVVMLVGLLLVIFIISVLFCVSVWLSVL